MKMFKMFKMYYELVKIPGVLWQIIFVRDIGVFVAVLPRKIVCIHLRLAATLPYGQ